MKVLDSSVGAVTNFELLDLLRSRGAGTELICPIFSVSLSEFEVFDYLKLTVACNQTREIFGRLIDECKKFDLTKAEIRTIANIRPTSAAELSPVISVTWRDQFSSVLPVFYYLVVLLNCHVYSDCLHLVEWCPSSYIAYVYPSSIRNCQTLGSSCRRKYYIPESV